MFTPLISRFHKVKRILASLAINILIALPCLNLTYADTLPSLGSEPGDVSLYDEYTIGKKVFAQIKSSHSYLDHPELEDFIMNRISPILTDQAFIEEQKYSDFQAANKIRLFFIDDPSLKVAWLDTMLLSLPEKTRKDYSEWSNDIRPWCLMAEKYERKIVMTHHCNKQGESPKDSLLGSVGIGASFEDRLIIQREGGTATLFTDGKDIDEKIVKIINSLLYFKLQARFKIKTSKVL